MKSLFTFSGILLISLMSAGAHYFGQKIPLIGGPVLAILSGIIISSTLKLPSFLNNASAFTSKRVLQLSIIVMGATLNLADIASTGISSMSVMLCTFIAAFSSAFLAGKFLGLNRDLRNLIGSGTAICGGSAIAAVSSVTKPDEHDVSYSLSTVFLFNIAAVLIFPHIGLALNLSPQGFGLLAGTAINDTSSVVAAGYIYGNEAGDYATVVKLTRTTFIIPLCIFFSILYRKKNSAGGGIKLNEIIPFFIMGFIAAASANTAGIIPSDFSAPLRESGKFMITTAMFAVGLRTDLKKIFRTGFKPLIFGFLVWLAVTVTAISIQIITRHT